MAVQHQVVGVTAKWWSHGVLELLDFVCFQVQTVLSMVYTILLPDQNKLFPRRLIAKHEEKIERISSIYVINSSCLIMQVCDVLSPDCLTVAEELKK